MVVMAVAVAVVFRLGRLLYNRRLDGEDHPGDERGVEPADRLTFTGSTTPSATRSL